MDLSWCTDCLSGSTCSQQQHEPDASNQARSSKEHGVLLHRGGCTTPALDSSAGVSPVGPGHILPNAAAGREVGAIASIDDPGLPGVVACRREGADDVQPGVG